jgi:tetratricopeptide (TPR) repeat protein/transcriptional regulator with XRE-family HTH domain
MSAGRAPTGEQLRLDRQALGLTQEELADKSGLSVRTIGDLERGKTRRPQRETGRRLADVLRLTAASDGMRSASLAGAPAQLPADLTDFTGRNELLEQLAGLLAGAGSNGWPGAVTVLTLAGPGGIGKTTVVVRAAHQAAARFPDGQIYLDLRGSSSHPLQPTDILGRLLRDLGADPAAVPADLGERAAHYRSLAAGRRLLIVLDDARDARQVRPLLPGTATAAVLVTSRSWLPDLQGSRQLELNALSSSEATDLLAAICGADRVTAEPAASDAVLSACAGLPLAVRIAGSRLVSRPGWGIHVLAARLADEMQRLEELQAGDLAVRATFQVSYTALPTSASPADDVARTFRLLGLWPGPDISAHAAAALLGLEPRSATRIMERLVDIHLLASRSAGRYRFHDLIRVFAAERAEQDDSSEVRDEAVRRVATWYLHTASAANTRMSRGQSERELQLVPAEPGTAPLAFADNAAAVDWTDSERANIAAAAHLAYSYGLDKICAQLAATAWPNFLRRPWDGWMSALQTGIDSAARSADAGARAWLLAYLGVGHIVQGGSADAVTCLRAALPLSRQVADSLCEATVILNLAIACKELKRYDEAIAAFETTLSVHRALGSRHVGSVLMNLGMLYVETGRLEEGVNRMERALADLTEAGNRGLESLAHSELANAYRQLGRTAEAIRWARSALKISREVRDPYQEAAALEALGQAFLAAADLDQAHSCLATAYAQASSLGIPEATQIKASLDALSATGSEPH